MALLETNREVYRRNPLAEVTVQLRFPPILRIETEPPAQLQDAIRDRYPLYRREMATGQLPPEIPAAVRKLIQGIGTAAGSVQHLFETQDRAVTAALSRETLTFKTTHYSRWEDFWEQFNAIRGIFEQAYQPAFYNRVGLRYVNIVRRSILGINDVAWADLLNPSIGGELSAPEFGESIDSTSRQMHCKIDANCFLTLRTGIALAELANADTPKEKCFLIDSDFHTHGRTEINDVATRLNIFNRACGNLFRWAIRQRLRDALEPKPLG